MPTHVHVTGSRGRRAVSRTKVPPLGSDLPSIGVWPATKFEVNEHNAQRDNEARSVPMDSDTSDDTVGDMHVKLVACRGRPHACGHMHVKNIDIYEYLSLIHISEPTRPY